MSSGINFSAARDVASDLLVADSVHGENIPPDLITRAGHLLALTDQKIARTPEQDVELLAVLDGLQWDKRFSGRLNPFHVAHEALARLIQARGAETGRPVEASAAAVLHGTPPSQTPDQNVVAVMGAGKMGSDIAYALLSAGFFVRVYDVQPSQVERSQENILRMIEKGVANGKLSRNQGIEMTRRLQFYSGEEMLSAAVNGAGYVMEAVFESYDVKIPLFQKLNAVAHPDTIFLTNTSTLSVTRLAEASGRPDRFAGAHFFWPAYSNPLLEITGMKGYSVVELEEGRRWVAEHGRVSPRLGPWRASEETIARADDFGRRLGKVVLTTVDTPGFIANRFFVPWAVEGAYLLDRFLAEYREAHPDLTVDEASTVAQELMILIDDATKKAFGVGLGPFRIMNETGPQIHFDSAISLGQLGEHYKPAASLTHLLALTPEGQKPLWPLPTSDEKDKRRAAKEVAAKEAALLSSLKTRLGDDRFGDLHRFIGERILGLTFRIVGDLYLEGYRMAQIDRAARVGLAWPDGPFALMKKVGFERARALASAVAEFPEGGFFTYGEIPTRLDDLIADDVSLVSLAVDEATGIGRIRIERPSRMNVLDPRIMLDLTRQFVQAEADPRVKMIVLEGVGGNLAGADIGFFVENLKRGAEGLQTIMDFVKAGLDLYSRFEKSEKRVVAVLDGNTFGGGFELALAAHDIIVTPQTKLALPETGLGIIPGLRGADRLAKRVGTGVAFWMMVTGDSGENAISGADLAAFEASISLVERADLEEKLRKFAAGEHNSLIRDQNPTQRRYDAIDDLFGFSARGSQMRQDLINGIEHPELAGEAKEIYDKGLVLAAKRPRAALQLANQLLEVASDDDDYRIVEQVFLTPMALQGLSSMGRKIEVVNRTDKEWQEFLFPNWNTSPHDGWQISVRGTSIFVETEPKLFDQSLEKFAGQVVVGPLNEKNSQGLINDISRVILRDGKDRLDQDEIIIARISPGGSFVIVAQPIKGGPTGQGGGDPSVTPAASTGQERGPSAGASEQGGGHENAVGSPKMDPRSHDLRLAGMTVGGGWDDDGENAGDRQQPSGRPDRLREQGIGRGSQGPEVEEREDRRPQRRGSSSGKPDDKRSPVSIKLVGSTAVVAGVVHLVGTSIGDEEDGVGRPKEGSRSGAVRRGLLPAGAGLPPVARPAGLPAVLMIH